jgi:hypothetical protein
MAGVFLVVAVVVLDGVGSGVAAGGGDATRGDAGRRDVRRAQADDLVTAQRLQERLEAAADQAAQHAAVNLDIADAGRSLNLLGGSGADETDLYSPCGQLLRHAFTLPSGGRRRHRRNYRSGT